MVLFFYSYWLCINLPSKNYFTYVFAPEVLKMQSKTYGYQIMLPSLVTYYLSVSSYVTKFEVYIHWSSDLFHSWIGNCR